MRIFKENLKTKVLVFALLIGLPLQMCTPGGGDDCNCGPITGRYFDINGMGLKNYKKVGENSLRIMLPNEAVSYGDYAGLTVDYSVDFISQIQSRWPSLSFIPSAYACSCIFDGESGSKFEKLSNLTVITLNDFDEAHRANDTINDLIIVKGIYFEEDAYLQAYLENDTTNIRVPAIQLLVDRKPTLNENYKVKIKVELSTGEVYEKVSETIKLQ